MLKKHFANVFDDKNALERTAAVFAFDERLDEAPRSRQVDANGIVVVRIGQVFVVGPFAARIDRSANGLVRIALGVEQVEQYVDVTSCAV